jgi:putative phage-type endonuclease
VRKEIPVEQLSDDWHSVRNGRVTGSRAGAILGCSPFSTREQTLKEMLSMATGRGSMFRGNVATQWGNMHEKDGIDWYESRTGWIVTPYGFFVHPEYDWLGYSPDGVVNENVLIEVKCPYSQKIPDHIPEHYFAQVQIGMEVLDLDSCDFIYWTPNEQRAFTLHRDPHWFAKNLTKLKSFVDDFNAIMQDPVRLDAMFGTDIDNDPITKRKADSLRAIAVKKQELNARLKELTVKEKELTDWFTDSYGEMDLKMEGLTLKHITRAGGYDTKRLYEDYNITGDVLDQYKKQDTHYTKIILEK